MSFRGFVGLLIALSGCVENNPPVFGCGPEGCPPCVADTDCADGEVCLGEICRPFEPCAAGIYVADRLPAEPSDGRWPADAIVRQREAGGDLRVEDLHLVVQVRDRPKLMEVDFFADAGDIDAFGVFTETRVRLGEAHRACTGVVGLRATRQHAVRVCLGGGEIALQSSDGSARRLAAAPGDATVDHVVRIAYTRRPDLPDGEFSIHVDAALVARVSGAEVRSEPAAQAPLAVFGAHAPGVAVFDFVRWGCVRDGGPCPVGDRDDDRCQTDRLPAGACGGRAEAPERCDSADNDCDGLIDEDFRVEYPGDRIAFDGFGVEAFLDEPCGLTGACAAARVACSADGTGLICDTTGLGAVERCDGADDDCDGLVDEDFGAGSPMPERLFRDPLTDAPVPLGDPCGVGACANGAVVCGEGLPVCSTDALGQADERCGDAIDNDCDGVLDEGFDLDGDGYQACPRCVAEACAAGPHDCDDRPAAGATVHPNAPERCDGLDDNCNGLIDEGLDVDGDGYLTCGPPGQVDCDDDPTDDRIGEPTAAERNPEAAERCDGTDNDCDARVDEAFAFEQAGRLTYATREHCGQCENDCAAAADALHTAPRCVERAPGVYGCATDCADGFFDVNGDLFDAEALWNLAGGVDGCECQLRVDTACDSGRLDGCAEVCNGVDDDCDGLVDEAFDMDLPTCWEGAPAERHVGACRDGRRACVDGRIVEACVDSVQARPERLCDGIDEDCDGRVDEGGGLTDLAGERQTGDACQTGRPGRCETGILECAIDGLRCAAPSPRAETCDGTDEDCDGRIDEGFVRADADGHPVDLNGQRVVDPEAFVYDQLEHCGGCGQRCALRRGITSCETGTCELIVCEDGYLDVDGDPSNGCEVSDCRPDNVGPENMRLIGQPCAAPMYLDGSACACGGVFQCVRFGGFPSVECGIAGFPPGVDLVPPAECPPQQRLNVEAEVCDGLDNDCDGRADEVFVVADDNGEPQLGPDGELLYTTIHHCGACHRPCDPPFALIASCINAQCGIERCEDNHYDLNGDVGDGCEYACVRRGDEICDGFDDDCDGAVDEGACP